MSVGENIKKLRTERNMKQTELAQKAGITQSMLCQIERGTKNPSLQIGYIISKILQCEVDDLIEKSDF